MPLSSKIPDLVIAVVGLGYVGLPLMLKFSEKFETIGFDHSQQRVDELKSGVDRNGEENLKENAQVGNLCFTSDPSDLSAADFIVIAVPTPVDETQQPDVSLLISASQLVGKQMKDKAVIVFESTVYPGCTRDVCVPILEQESGKKLNDGFYCGYSPERINPGKGNKTIGEIVKVTSGSNEYSEHLVAEVYREVIEAGVHKAPSIEIAEASKVIENVQRDVNIALMNEFAQLFGKLGLNTQDILEAARTKWNFLPFTPGLVGGHCISVDPYYLAYKAKEIGFKPSLLNTARKVNDSMPAYIVDKVLTDLGDLTKKDALQVLVCGLSFKENCSDVRNSLAVEVVKLFKHRNIAVHAFDPLLEGMSNDIKITVDLTSRPKSSSYDAIIFTVVHSCFIELGEKFFHNLLKREGLIFDVKSSLPKSFCAISI